MSDLPELDLQAALRDLDRVTKSFVERLGAAQAVEAPPRAPTEPPAPANPAPAAGGPPMRDAEREARDYLAEAKRRADSLVEVLVAAIERDAAKVRRESEAEAADRVEEAQRVAERIVAERQRRIAELSDGIAARAGALAAGMEDAGRIGRQFDAFVRALAAAAARIATDPATAPARTGSEPDGLAEPGSLAA